MLFALWLAGLVAAVGSLLAVTLLISIVLNLALGVPFAGTPRRRLDVIFDHLQLPPGAQVHDLGCGDGRVVFAAAARGANATGWELQPLTYLRAKLTQLVRYPQAQIRWGNFRRANLRDADYVFCFLVADAMPRVAAWLKPRLKAGSTVVSHGFPLPGWKPTRVIPPDHPGGSATFIYRISHASTSNPV